jgi:mono/diheme cytochrome c family protein
MNARLDNGASPRRGRSAALALCALGVLALVSIATARTAAAERKSAPKRLADTGLYADFATKTVRADNLPFTPQYPLWTDGAAKKRWIHLPPGTAIDASDADVWKFPIGTKVWKEFAFERRIETRYMERGADGRWIYATYVWSQDERDAVLAPERGIRNAYELEGGAHYEVPGVMDCRACHQGHPAEVLGFSALQLSTDRDPLAPHAAKPAADELDLKRLVERGLVRGLADEFVAHAPRIDASSPRARAALGYLHGNCGHCHNDTGPLAGLELALAQQTDAAADSAERTLASLVGQSSRFRTAGADAATRRVVPGRKEASVLTVRMRSANPLARMPPLGVQVIDDAGLALVERWIRNDLHQP